jgi:hypothetical protein
VPQYPDYLLQETIRAARNLFILGGTLGVAFVVNDAAFGDWAVPDHLMVALAVADKGILQIVDDLANVAHTSCVWAINKLSRKPAQLQEFLKA